MSPCPTKTQDNTRLDPGSGTHAGYARGMGNFASAARYVIDETFEAGSGDVRDDVEPIFIWSRRDRVDVLRGELREDHHTLELRYTILDSSLEDADVLRLFHIAYLDVLTNHHWFNKVHFYASRVRVRLVNAVTGVTATTDYPDPE